MRISVIHMIPYHFTKDLAKLVSSDLGCNELISADGTLRWTGLQHRIGRRPSLA